ncbi:cytokine receptor [Stomoxys calcitrans]|uniref:cytokine receptor n=1 Tax=Stomoxys calcitrans TaxID=35570 RepID=UPI0027E30265|nr:cytokine receptor [Stomoxys calcitrans]
MQKVMNGLNLLMRTIIIVLVLLQWSSTHSVYAESVSYNATGSPGEMTPSRLDILVGTNAALTCTVTQGNGTNIWFNKINTNTRRGRKIVQPTDEIQVVGPHSAILKIENAEEQKSDYECMFDKYAIGLSSLYVGTPPQNVTDFDCMVYDYANMRCGFTVPENNIQVTYDLDYRLSDKSNFKTACQLENSVQKLQCNITDYLPGRDKYIFRLTANNALGKNVQEFIINNHKIVKLQPLDIRVENTTSDGVMLKWDIDKISYYRAGLVYELKIRDNYTDWRTLATDDIHPQGGIFSETVKDLYPFWNYTIQVRGKSRRVDKDEDRFWSDPTLVSFSTKSRPPHTAPDAPVGSFYSTETQLSLYWSPLPEHKHCGPGFHYVVNEFDSYGVVINSSTVNTTTLTLDSRNESLRIFSIKSANDYGHSPEGSVIRVYGGQCQFCSQYELDENNIVKGYHNDSYTLSWSPPNNDSELQNYTVFWCTPQIESVNQCKGPISYKYVDKYTTNYTTEPEDRSLNMAISANYPHYNRGMQWARCSREVSNMRMEIEATVLNESSVLVKWSSGSVCPSILKGYKLTYCQQTDSVTCKTVSFLGHSRNYTIPHLRPYKEVCVSMYMFSSSKNGSVSESICVRTEEGAPSPPMHVVVKPKSVTSKSAKIEWEPPKEHNGIVRSYTVYWYKFNNLSTMEKATNITQTSYNLTELNSSTNYTVYVTAHTVKGSEPSEHLHISTLIGTPSFPRNVRILNDSIISWDKPDFPSAYYLVALVARYSSNKTTYERVSVVNGQSCKFQLDCTYTSQEVSFSIRVRAINFGGQQEIDKDIKSMHPSEIRLGAEIDQSFCEPVKEAEVEVNAYDILDGSNQKSYFASDWIDPQFTSKCAPNNTAIFVISFVIVLAFVAYIFYRVRNKYYKMKNIKVILPDGLIDHVPNYEFSGKGSRKSSNSDLLMNFHRNDLKSKTMEQHSNAFSSLSSTSSSKDHQIDDHQIGEHPSLETTNEELSSNSSLSSHSILTYQNLHNIQQSPNRSGTPVEDDETNEMDNHAKGYTTTQNIGGNGYVTHNSQFLASLLNASERNVPSFPAMTNDGYIQPSAAKQLFQPQIQHPPIAASQNGYTTLEALGKMTAMPDEATQNTAASPITSPQSTNAHQFTANSLATINTSPVITDLDEIEHHNKEVTAPQPGTAGSTAISHQPNTTNNNSIYGYVTQQQLANFGNNVALAMELNT